VIDSPRAVLERRGFALAYLSMAWMTVEAVVAVAAGIAAHSIALVGFGLDSVIEFFAAGVVVWQLRGVDETRERQATRLIGSTFFVLAAYVAFQAIRDLAIGAKPQVSVVGLVVAGVAIVAMPLLAVGKRRVGRALANSTLLADAAETTFCAVLSGATIIGVGLNAAFGWYWADPIAALVIAAFAVKEGREAFESEGDGATG
jgi:divalent metal cation (Fe/Co/Zn/Cd) transporter